MTKQRDRNIYFTGLIDFTLDWPVRFCQTTLSKYRNFCGSTIFNYPDCKTGLIVCICVVNNAKFIISDCRGRNTTFTFNCFTRICLFRPTIMADRQCIVFIGEAINTIYIKGEVFSNRRNGRGNPYLEKSIGNTEDLFIRQPSLAIHDLCRILYQCAKLTKRAIRG